MANSTKNLSIAELILLLGPQKTTDTNLDD